MAKYYPAITVYSSAFGDVRLPEGAVVRIKANGWPDSRFNEGKKYREYLLHVEKLAEQEFLAGRQLKVAPSFAEWASA